MRLMCPNCDAEYEVDASAIPESGRDVQCSNCGHAWFQHHPDLEADHAAESALYDPPPPLSKSARPDNVLPSDLDWQVESDDPEAILDAMGREARQDGADVPYRAPQFNKGSESPEFGNTQPSDTVQSDTTSNGSAPVPKHDIDPEALRILREEAELETAQRALEQGGAAQAAAGGPVVARRVARLKGIQPPAPNPPAQSAPTTVAPAPPSDRLPKIETVSAGLRNDDLLPEPAAPTTGRGGIVTILFIALLGTAGYVLSPDLAVIMPSLAKPLAQYVAFVDTVRDQLDTLLPKLVTHAQSLFALVKGWF